MLRHYDDLLGKMPDSLLNNKHTEDDISIIIGENGSGKSTLLRYLGNHFSRRGKKVIAIANTIHDKFDSRKKNIHALRNRRGRKQIVDIIKKTMSVVSSKNERGLYHASNVLSYVGFNPVIGVKINVLHADYEEILRNVKGSDPYDKVLLSELLHRVKFEQLDKDIHWFETSGNVYKDMREISLTKLFPFEPIMKRLGITLGFEMYLMRKNEPVPLLDASSGELSLIASLVYISTVIEEDRTVILVDEPENSLHPKWQKEYTKMILDLFHYHRPKVVLATHSPIIVNGAEEHSHKPSIYESKDFSYSLVKTDTKNIEESYLDLFGLLTPENRYLSNILIKDLNALAEKRINIESIKAKFQELKDASYDVRQAKVIDAASEIGEEIVRNGNELER